MRYATEKKEKPLVEMSKITHICPSHVGKSSTTVDTSPFFVCSAADDSEKRAQPHKLCPSLVRTNQIFAS